MIYRPKFFILQELVPPSLFDLLGEQAWELFDQNALIALDKLREHFGAIVVNDWHKGGPYKESGLRETNTKTGAPRSAHKVGKAFDCKPKKWTVSDMYNYVVDNPREFPEIRRVENIRFTPTWFHFDTIEHGNEGIRVFRP